jgi:polyisoprenyl-teichoic acid--peptidoglycan teichoic acid transferase
VPFFFDLRGFVSDKREMPLWSRLLVAFGLIVLAAAGGAFLGLRSVTHEVVQTVKREPLLGEVRTEVERKHADVKGAKNILLVGIDTRVSWGTDMPSRSDSIILLHIPADRSGAYLISLPRDSYVQIPAYDNGVRRYYGGKEKINAAFMHGSHGLTGAAADQHGFELLAMTVKKLTGITPDAAAIIDFNGFKDVLQLLGKICMYVDEEVISIHVGHTADGKVAVPYTTDESGRHPRRVHGVTPNRYTKGDHCFTPEEALDYARQRDLLADQDGDYGRQRHQQQLLKAIMRQVYDSGLSAPSKLPGLMQALGRTMTVDDGGIGIEDWAFAMRGIEPEKLVTIRTNKGEFNSREIGGVGSVEILSPTTKQLLKAAKDDKVDAFLKANPGWVAAS